MVGILLGLPLVASFGTHAKLAVDQEFLDAVILLQAMAIAGVVRIIHGIFTSSLSLGILARLVAVGLLLFMLFGLSVCSMFAQSGWQGG